MAQFVLEGLLGLREQPLRSAISARVTFDIELDERIGVRDQDTVFDVTLSVYIEDWEGRAHFSSYDGLLVLLARDLKELHESQREEACLVDWDQQDVLWFRRVPDHPDWIVLSGQLVLFVDETQEGEFPSAPFKAMDNSLAGESSMALLFRSIRTDRSQLRAFADGLLAMLRDKALL